MQRGYVTRLIGGEAGLAPESTLCYDNCRVPYKRREHTDGCQIGVGWSKGSGPSRGRGVGGTGFRLRNGSVMGVKGPA